MNNQLNLPLDMKRTWSVLILLFFCFESYSQAYTKEDSITLRNIFNTALLDGKSYDWLDHLSNEIGSRLSGSYGAERAVQYTKKELVELGLDKVWLQRSFWQ